MHSSCHSELRLLQGGPSNHYERKSLHTRQCPTQCYYGTIIVNHAIGLSTLSRPFSRGSHVSTLKHRHHREIKILVVVTVGGATNVAPILQVCSVLAQRGHRIDFATLQTRESLASPYPFISNIHTLGRGITATEEEQLYSRFNEWDGNTIEGKRTIVWVKRFHDSLWPETYHKLKHLVQVVKPDLIFADYQVEATRDVTHEACISLVVMWCQMPWLLMPQKYIPGQPGMQQRCLTSENASIYDRLFDATNLLRAAPYFLQYLSWMRKMRREAGLVNPPQGSKPDHLLLVNSFWGIEPPKDLPPLAHPVGPLLSDSYTPLDPASKAFLDTHPRVVYVAFGTHVLMTAERLTKLIAGLDAAIQGDEIDGVFWAIKDASRACVLQTANVPILNGPTYQELFRNGLAKWFFADYAPQRAVLRHSSVKIFVTHAGPSSANESIFHGVPMIAMGIYGDQLPNSRRLVEAGVAIRLDRNQFTSASLSSSISCILNDEGHCFERNVLRMQCVAQVNSRRKYLAADLVEEYLFDWELRFEHTPNWGLEGKAHERGKELRPMHLQTADARMSWLKRNNLDLYILAAVVFPILPFLLIVLLFV
ncbi:glycosyltransferase family 1 protein [Viridothelium virens]|uniref:Glycosyltransferase family 1 protein n=1 Tax=Viridothelium virens TaxID=1048519 RepID=A0A6A6GTZ8_VIRVR|nr:glycosyltransferase family 1 protein [Viridothelium virens]